MNMRYLWLFIWNKIDMLQVIIQLLPFNYLLIAFKLTFRPQQNFLK